MISFSFLLDVRVSITKVIHQSVEIGLVESILNHFVWIRSNTNWVSDNHKSYCYTWITCVKLSSWKQQNLPVNLFQSIDLFSLWVELFILFYAKDSILYELCGAKVSICYWYIYVRKPVIIWFKMNIVYKNPDSLDKKVSHSSRFYKKVSK